MKNGETKLTIINKSIDLVSEIYLLSKLLPKEEKYIIIPQILRAAISIPSNIAEGNNRSPKEFIRYINIARGSLNELSIQLVIITRIYNIKSIKANDLIDEIGRMTYGLKRTLNSRVSIHKSY